MSEAHTDPKRIAKALPLGAGVFVPCRVHGGPWETVWLLKDSAEHINALGAEPNGELRAERLKERVDGFTVVVVVLLLRIGSGETAQIYQTWVNGQDSDVLEALASQPRQVVQLYSEDGSLCRTLVVDNQLKRLAGDALIDSVGLAAWSPRHFESACEQIQGRFADLESLWDVLPRPNV
jgi:hypothetical protein